jgi:hypothetical protein
VSHVEKNYKRVVVPTITNLDVDTWTEFGRPPRGTEGMSKCYLTFDGEFKWTKDDTEFVPVTSRVGIRLQCVRPFRHGLFYESNRFVEKSAESASVRPRERVPPHTGRFRRRSCPAGCWR